MGERHLMVAKVLPRDPRPRRDPGPEYYSEDPCDAVTLFCSHRRETGQISLDLDKVILVGWHQEDEILHEEVYLPLSRPALLVMGDTKSWPDPPATLRSFVK